MSNQLTKRRTGWMASLGWLVQPIVLLSLAADYSLRSVPLVFC